MKHPDFPDLTTQEELDQQEMADLEFSDYGRSARFGPGWWFILAVITCALAVWLF